MRTVLIFGFEPFGGRPVNTSEDIVRALGDDPIARHAIVRVVLPCVFGRARTMLLRHIRRVKPVIVIGLGEAGGRRTVTPERVAINVDDARIADNRGARPIDRPIVKNGPAAYFSTLPIKAMVQVMRRRGVRAEISQTAGTFVCNHAFYGLMHAVAHDHRRVRAGFIHVPALPARKHARPRPTLERMTVAIRAAIRTAITTRRDTRRSGGGEA